MLVCCAGSVLPSGRRCPISCDNIATNLRHKKFFSLFFARLLVCLFTPCLLGHKQNMRCWQLKRPQGGCMCVKNGILFRTFYFVLFCFTSGATNYGHPHSQNTPCESQLAPTAPVTILPLSPTCVCADEFLVVTSLHLQVPWLVQLCSDRFPRCNACSPLLTSGLALSSIGRPHCCTWLDCLKTGYCFSVDSLLKRAVFTQTVPNYTAPFYFIVVESP